MRLVPLRKLAVRWRLRVFGLVLTVPPLLHVVAVHRLAARWSTRRNGYAAPPIEVLADEVDAWLTRLPWPWRSTCLKRASILYALLRRSGEPVELHIGVKREADKSLAAHAWLVRDGQPYLEPPATQYASFQVITAFPEMSPHNATR
ncbi:MAG: lasso peptide biosynthesis B2 protein [Gemmatimonas sp.]